MDFTIETLEEVLKDLLSKRPIFHSEADFQFALAWRIKEMFKDDIKVRLEYPVEETQEKINHIDIVLFLEGKMIPIELKYKTKLLKKFKEPKTNEEYNLKQQSAQNLACYHYLYDILRIENITKKESNKCKNGYTIFLTNDEWYITEPRERTKVHSVAIYDRDEKGNSLRNIKTEINYKWTENGKEKGANEKFVGEYECKWHKYKVESQEDTSVKFYYLINEIKAK